MSVIVPVRNEVAFITRCLQALAMQDYPRERYEVIVVDGESTDGTAAEVRQMSLAYGVPDIFRTNEKQTAPAGFNLGLERAGGEIIIKVDGHTRVDANFISASVKALQESGADAVGGPIRTRGHGVVGRAIALAMSSPFGVGDAAFRHSDREQWTDSVAFGAYWREVFDRLGGLAEDLPAGDDDEFNYRLRNAGGRILLTPAIGSVYFARETLGELLRQYWRYGLAKAAVLSRHPNRLRPRHLVPSTLVLTLLGGTLVGLARPRFLLLPLAAALSYAAANVIATLRIARQGNWQEARYIPLAFMCMHFGAGAGMLAGLARLARDSVLRLGRSRD